MAVSELEAPQRFGYTQELRRSVGMADLLFYGLIFMVPIAPFAIFGAVYSASGGMPALAYAIGMAALLFTAASYTQMVKAFPLSGSVYNYAGRALGAPIGFLTGWAILLDYILVPSLLYLVAGVAMNSTLPGIPVWVWIIAFIAFNTVINLRGIKITALFTKVMIFAELATLALFLAVGCWALAHGRGHGFSLAPLFNKDTFSWPILLGATSVAVLSFLGFDGIAMLVEEAKGGAASIGRAMRWALILAGVLFIVQVWVAALLVPDQAGLLANGDPNGTAFYDAAAAAGGNWLSQVTSTATGLSWGLADTLVAQVAVSRLLFAMARDRQLPSFLAKVSVRRSVPANATLFVAGLSTVLVLGIWYFDRGSGIGLLASLINMGALIAFVVLHVCVIVHYMGKVRSKNIWSHLIVPLVGMAILIEVIINANVLAQEVGGIWLAIGVIVLAGLYAAGRRPAISGLSLAIQGDNP